MFVHVCLGIWPGIRFGPELERAIVGGIVSVRAKTRFRFVAGAGLGSGAEWNRFFDVKHHHQVLLPLLGL